MLQLTGQLATLANLNLRIEKLGKDNHRSAADVKIQIDVHASVLEQLHPGLQYSLYKRPDEQGHQADLTAPDPNALTTPRYPHAKPWQSTEDWPGYFATIKAGDFDVKAVELDKVTLKGITAEAKNGGTVSLSFSLGGNPSPEDVATLYELMGDTVELTINPPALGDLAKLRAEAKAKPKADAADPGEGDDDDDQPPTDSQAGRAFPDAIDGRQAGGKADKKPAKPKGGKSASAGLH